MKSLKVERKIWVDGQFVPWEQATVHVLSHSMQRGSLIFDYMVVHETARGPAIFRLREHLQRLKQSAELVGLPLLLSEEELVRYTLETARANPGACNVKISVYLPSIEMDLVPADASVSVAIAAYDPRSDIARGVTQPLPRASRLQLYLERDKLRTDQRFIPPQAKVSANYLSPMLAKWKARKEGYDDILLMNEAGCLTEAPTSNVFLIDAGGCLRTPSTQFVLEGVTRSALLELARRDGIPVSEGRIGAEEVFEAKEIFLSTTTHGVWPVESVDGRIVGGEGAPCPGPLSARLRERFKQVERGEDPEFMHWLTFIDEDS